MAVVSEVVFPFMLETERAGDAADSARLLAEARARFEGKVFGSEDGEGEGSVAFTGGAFVRRVVGLDRVGAAEVYPSASDPGRVRYGTAAKVRAEIVWVGEGSVFGPVEFRGKEENFYLGVTTALAPLPAQAVISPRQPTSTNTGTSTGTGATLAMIRALQPEDKVVLRLARATWPQLAPEARVEGEVFIPLATVLEVSPLASFPEAAGIAEQLEGVTARAKASVSALTDLLSDDDTREAGLLFAELFGLKVNEAGGASSSSSSFDPFELLDINSTMSPEPIPVRARFQLGADGSVRCVKESETAEASASSTNPIQTAVNSFTLITELQAVAEAIVIYAKTYTTTKEINDAKHLWRLLPGVS